MKTLRELLVERCVAEGWDMDEEGLQELLCEGYPVVWEGDNVESRWYTAATAVVQVVDGDNKRYFSHSICTYSGENSPEDAGFYPTAIDDIQEVFPVQVMTTVYVTESNL